MHITVLAAKKIAKNKCTNTFACITKKALIAETINKTSRQVIKILPVG